MPGTVFLEGDSIELRTIEEEDLEFLRDGVNLPAVRVNIGNRTPVNMENQQEFFENVVCSDEELHLLICRDDERMGIVSVRQEGDRAEKLGSLGIWLQPDFHGSGYGTEASELIIDHSFNQMNYHRLYARAHADNKASQRLWEKLGFQEEGRLREHTYLEGEYRDVIYYGILEGEWR